MDYLEYIGYGASFIILISIVMNSIIKLRWINLAGSLIFTVYGVLIGAMPVAFMNAGIVVINIYYLTKIYNTRDYFRLLEIKRHTTYLDDFISYYSKDLIKYFKTSDFQFSDDSIGFYVLRNMVPAGLFIATVKDSSTLQIDLDYAIPEYRDTKIGTYVYETNKDFFLDQGYNRLEATPKTPAHHTYLSKMGFIRTEEDLYYKELIA
jgi:hypothetical protein